MRRIPLWLDLRHVAADQRGPFLDAAQVARCEAIIAADVQVRAGRLLRGADDIGAIVRMESGADQERAVAEPGVVVVEAGDWTIIPLENLIAARRDRPGTVFAVAHGRDEALRLCDTLELGVHGIVLRPTSPDDVRNVHHALQQRGERRDDAPTPPAGTDDEPLRLMTARVSALSDAGPGDRVCVDTTSVFAPGEGLLVGSTARAFALVHAENIASEFVAARPFRVNAGAVHCYVVAPAGRTRYLSELASGDRVLAVNQAGATRELTVGRAKIERRPHTLVRWTSQAGAGSIVVQTAETIRFVRPDGTPVAVTDLAVGDEILVHHQSAARHFGMPVVESLEER